MTPIALIIRTAGTNCDRELAHAFSLAGATPVTRHLNELIAQPRLLEQADLIGFPGGFSYGDDIAAGRIMANRVRHRLFEPLVEAVACGVPIIGICNGFQVLAQMGLLPDPRAGRQQVTLAANSGGRFIDRWVGLESPADTVCIWTRGLGRLDLPIAHGEGRFVPASDQVLEELQANGQVALRYAPFGGGREVSDEGGGAVSGGGRGKGDSTDRSDGNPNGSVDDIAGICDRTGLVLGLMPHPERYTHATNHPWWSRWQASGEAPSPAGLRLFIHAVEHVRAELGTAVTPDAAAV